MKFLQDYMEEKQSKLFKDNGVFFAFSEKQLNKVKKEGVKYVSCGFGMICPEENVDVVIDSLDTIHINAIKQDIEENTREGVIKRELWNHEAIYSGDIQDTINSLKGYGITDNQVSIVFKALVILDNKS